MPLELYANDASTTVTSGTTTAPAGGTVQTWTVTSSTAFPAASSSATPPTQFHIADPAAAAELMAVTNVSGTSWTVTRGAEGTTPVVHAAGFTVREVTSAGALTALQTPGSFNVRNWGATGNGSTNDYTALQALISAVPAGSEIFFPAGTYIVGTTLELPGNMTYRGANKDTTIIQAAATANLNATAASLGWLENTNTSAVSPVVIRELSFYGNQAQTSGMGHGLVLQTFWSYVEDCCFSYTFGDGLRFDTNGVNGTTALGNTATENRAVRCQSRFNGVLSISPFTVLSFASGIRASDPAVLGAYTDGWVVDCVADVSGGNGIQVDDGAGWHLTGNHVYGAQASGIQVSRPWMTKITSNYVETWGTSATSGAYFAVDCYNGFVNDAGYGSVISGNVMFLSTAPGNGGTFIGGIGVQASSGGQATATITGNEMNGTLTSNAQFFGIALTCQNSAASVAAAVSGNSVNGTAWGAGLLILNTGGGTGNITLSGDCGAYTVPLAATFNSAAGTAVQTVTGMVTTLPIGIYVLHGVLFYGPHGTTGSTQLIAWTFTGTAAAAAASWTATSGTSTAQAGGTALTAGVTTPTLAAGTSIAEFWAHAVVTAAGTLQLTVKSTTGGDEITVLAGSYLNVQPVSA